MLAAVEVMYIMFSTPLMLCSRGTITLFCTASALAPAYVVDTITVGGAMSGYCSTGRFTSEMSPRKTIATADITANIGRRMID